MVLDRKGDLRLSEMTVSTIEELFDAANYRRSIRTVTRGRSPTPSGGG